MDDRDRSEGFERDREDLSDPIADSEDAIGAPSAADVEDEIARDLLAIQVDSYGRGAAAVRSRIEGDTLIVVLEDLQLLPAEEFLIGNGRDEAVQQMRQRFQQAIAPTFRAAVERATGRRVIAFLSNTHLDEPRFAVEIFRLEPER